MHNLSPSRFFSFMTKSFVFVFLAFFHLTANANGPKNSSRNPNILNLAKQHLLTYYDLQNQTPFEITPRWNYYLKESRRDILNFKSLEEAIIHGQKKVNFDHRGYCTNRDELIEQKALVEKEFPLFKEQLRSFSDSVYSIPGTFVMVDGTPISNVILYHSRYILQCLTHLKNPKIICEIGGGYGSAARLWMTNSIHNPDIYIMVDFAESLFFAEVFLKANLENIDIIYITDIFHAHIEQLVFHNKTIILCPVQSAHLLVKMPIDLTFNTGSLQEMTPSAVQYWMEWLDHSLSSNFYSLNYFGREMIKDFYGNFFAPVLSDKWKCILKQGAAPLVALHGGKYFAEIFAKRIEEYEKDSFESVSTEFYAKIDRQMNIQNLLDCMDIIRRFPKQELVLMLLKKLSDINYLPHEVGYLLKLIEPSIATCSLESQELYYSIKSHVDGFLMSAQQNLYDESKA